jgi:hypothetical protein
LFLISDENGIIANKKAMGTSKDQLNAIDLEKVQKLRYEEARSKE